MSAPLTVLIVGGYGAFGGRLVQLFENDPRLTLLVAGRSWKKAHAFCSARVKPKAQLVPAQFDRDGDLARQLEILRPNIVVDASGPFQAYGERRYALIEACIAARVHYLDLADGADFVAGVGALDKDAAAAGVYAISGASSLPALTAAATRRLSSGMRRVDSIRAGIAPSPFVRVGENVIRAITGYAGKRIPLRRDGGPGFGYPFTEQIRFTVAPPGCVPLKSTLFSLLDAPDPKLLATLWPDARTIWIGVGPVPEALHRTLIAFAWLVRLRLLRSLSSVSPLIHFVARHLSWGEHRSGMFVEVQGLDSVGNTITRSWHVLAEGDDGPLIPSMAAAAIISKTLAGRPPAAGARAAIRDLELQDYEPWLEGRAIITGMRDELPRSAPLYKRVLGAAWETLPDPIAAMHDVKKSRIAEGRADVDRGKGLVARVIAAAIGLPEPGRDLPVSVRFERVNDAEIWTRTFAGRSFSSTQFEGRGRASHLICERFGPLSFKMALATDVDRLRLVLRGWTVFGIPLPRWLSPRATAYETVQDGRFRFHVELSLPWGGLIVRYRGWLAPVDEKIRVRPALEAVPVS